MPKSNEDHHLDEIRDEHFPDSDERKWPPSGGGWFMAPRALPVLLQVLREKDVAGRGDLGRVYVELLSRVRMQGVVLLDHPEDHARLIGYSYDRRGQRTWREAMCQLRDLGFLEVKPSAGRGELGYALIVNPYVPVKRLHARRKIPDALWSLFHDRWSKARAKKPKVDLEQEPARQDSSPPIPSAPARTQAPAPGRKRAKTRTTKKR